MPLEKMIYASEIVNFLGLNWMSLINLTSNMKYLFYKS